MIFYLERFFNLVVYLCDQLNASSIIISLLDGFVNLNSIVYYFIVHNNTIIYLVHLVHLMHWFVKRFVSIVLLLYGLVMFCSTFVSVSYTHLTLPTNREV